MSKIKIIGATVGTTLPKPNWDQKDPVKGDYIKNKPGVVTYTEQSLTDEQKALARKNIGITGTGKDGKDGKDGYTPVKGVDYFDGKDGYTPVKGKDYFDGEDGRNGRDGYTPVKGVDYFDGKDGKNGADGRNGTSVTITKISESTDSGGSNLVAFSDGKTLTIKNGKDGKDGQDGVTPTKGIDYFDGKDGSDYVLTEVDKQEIAEMAAELVEIPGGEVTEEEHTAELTIVGFTRFDGGTFSTATTGRRTDYIPTEGVTKVFGNVGFYSACSTVAFYDANKAYLSDIRVGGSDFLPSGNNYGDGAFEVDLTDEKYAAAKYFVVSSYRNTSQAGYYTQGTDFSVDYCKYTKAGEAEETPRYRIGKNTIAFFGDSITEGGYPELIASITGATVANYGVGGATVAAGTAGVTHVVEQITAYNGNHDIICVSGGYNDFCLEVPLGILTEGYKAALDTTTLIGALENIFRNLMTNHSTAQIFYIITHKIDGAEARQNEIGLTLTDYHDAIVRVLEKYSIPCYDAFADSGLVTSTASDWGATLRELYTMNADGTHPNEDGYLKYYVYQIIAMMENGISSGRGKAYDESKIVNAVLAALPVYHGEVEEV